MASTTKRRFTEEFKLEAVALWETSGLLETEVAAELGIMPTMLRRWQRQLQESSAPPASPAAKPSASPRLRSGQALRRCRDEVRFYRAACVHLAGERHVPQLGVSRSGYYDWCGRAPSARTMANLALLGDVRRRQARHQG